MTAAVYKSGYMLESLGNPTLPDNGDNAMGAGNQQGRPDQNTMNQGGARRRMTLNDILAGLEPSETVRRTLTTVR